MRDAAVLYNKQFTPVAGVGVGVGRPYLRKLAAKTHTTCREAMSSRARHFHQYRDVGHKEKIVMCTDLNSMGSVLDLGKHRNAYAEIKRDGWYVEFWRVRDRIYFSTGHGKLMKLFVPAGKYLASMDENVRMRGELVLVHSDVIGDGDPVDRDNWETFKATNAFFKPYVFSDGTVLSAHSVTDARFTSIDSFKEWSTVSKPDGGTVNILIYVHNLVEHNASLNTQRLQDQLSLASTNFVLPNWIKVKTSEHACDMLRTAIADAHEGLVFFLIISGAGNDSDQADESENTSVWIKAKERLSYTAMVVLEGVEVKGRTEYTVVFDHNGEDAHVRLGNCKKWASRVHVKVDVIPRSINDRRCRFGIGMGLCPPTPPQRRIGSCDGCGDYDYCAYEAVGGDCHDASDPGDTPASVAATTAIYVGEGAGGAGGAGGSQRPRKRLAVAAPLVSAPLVPSAPAVPALLVPVVALAVAPAGAIDVIEIGDDDDVIEID